MAVSFFYALAISAVPFIYRLPTLLGSRGSCRQAAAKTFGCYRTVLLCSHGLPCCCFQGSQAASFSHQGPRYQVQARATVIFFDITAFEADGALRRSSSSLASVDHPNRPLTREHGGLMRWPENFYRPREQRKPNCEGTCPPANSLSARAMQQSILAAWYIQLTSICKDMFRSTF
ncbi:hypothetical protein NC652_019456 [Populus alba x Populus x berolinensis]|nr:hypothetical protein NC652_019456 [Populus alba x Populus x berolinensis]